MTWCWSLVEEGGSWGLCIPVGPKNLGGGGGGPGSWYPGPIWLNPKDGGSWNGSWWGCGGLEKTCLFGLSGLGGRVGGKWSEDAKSFKIFPSALGLTMYSSWCWWWWWLTSSKWSKVSKRSFSKSSRSIYIVVKISVEFLDSMTRPTPRESFVNEYNSWKFYFG